MQKYLRQRLVQVILVLVFLLATGAGVYLVQHPTVFSPKASTGSLSSLAGIPSIGFNKHDLFSQYLGLGNNMFVKNWKQQWKGFSDGKSHDDMGVGSKAVRYAESFDLGYNIRMHTTPIKSGEPTFSLFLASDKFPINPNTNYLASAIIRKGDSRGDFRIVVLDEQNKIIQEKSLPLTSLDNDGWRFKERRFSFKTPANAKFGHIRFQLDAFRGQDANMDINQASLAANGSTVNILPNPSFNWADTTDSVALARQDLDEAKDLGINYFRVSAGGYCSMDFKFWQNDPNTYWQLFDNMVKDASARNMRLIPVIQWYTHAFAHLAGEPLSKLFDTNSQSNQLLKRYTQELVSRYKKDDKNILFWELTNELNLGVDLNLDDHENDHCYPAWANNHSPKGIDSYSSEMLKNFIADWSSFIKNIDSNHLISTGFSIPRRNAQHMRLKPGWVEGGPDWTNDSYDEMKTWLEYVHPPSVDIVSVHNYSTDDWSIADTYRAATAMGKYLFVGEFGDRVPNSPTGEWNPGVPYLKSMLADIIRLKIPFSAVWEWKAYDSFYPPTIHPGTLSLNLHRDIVDLVVNANNQLKQLTGPTSTPTPTPRPTNTPALTVVNSQFIGTAITKPDYDYGPTILKDDDNTYKMYWCSVDPDDKKGDNILYATSPDGKNWSNFRVVLRPTPNSEETAGEADGHTCDPSVVKVNNKYFMYYTAASLSGHNNQIFLATSTNGLNWIKYPNNSNPQPVIKNTARSGGYGIGQSTVFFLNGKFYHYYTDTDKGGEMLVISTDGINWQVQNNDKPVFEATNWIPTYLKDRNILFAIEATDETQNYGINYSFSADGINWQPSRADPSKKILVAGNRGSIHNAGILTDTSGLVSGSSIVAYYGAGRSASSEVADSASWDIDITRIDVGNPPTNLTAVCGEGGGITVFFDGVVGFSGYYTARFDREPYSDSDWQPVEDPRWTNSGSGDHMVGINASACVNNSCTINVPQIDADKNYNWTIQSDGGQIISGPAFKCALPISTPTPQTTRCTASYALSPASPVGPNTNVSVRVSAQSPNINCVVLFQDGVKQSCRIPTPVQVGVYDCSVSTGTPGTRTLQLKFGQSSHYPPGTSCGQEVACNPFNYLVSGFIVPTNTPIPTPTSTPASLSCEQTGDIDGNGVTNLEDYNFWQRSFLGNNLQADCNKDGRVDLEDYYLWWRKSNQS